LFRWCGITSPVPGQPPSAIVLVCPTAAFAPDSAHARCEGRRYRWSGLSSILFACADVATSILWRCRISQWRRDSVSLV
jgi:hypothetical protein